MVTLEVNGATVAYSDTGHPADNVDAPTIVFGHGLLFSGWMFEAQIAALRATYRCVAIDWRGQGRTPAAVGGYDMDTLTEDAVGLITALGVAPVHYVGLSMGGFVGQRIAARTGHLLRSLTLLDTSPDREESRAALQDRLLACAYRVTGMNRLLISQVLPIMFGPTFRADPSSQPVIDRFVAQLRRSDRRGLTRAVLAVANREPIDAEILTISVPTLVIVGADDRPTPPAKAQRIVERIPGARLEIVPDAGHSSTVEQPAAITELISRFVARVDAGN